jgi:PRTRC genetic system protein E
LSLPTSKRSLLIFSESGKALFDVVSDVSYCSGRAGISHITQEEMKDLMKSALTGSFGCGSTILNSRDLSGGDCRRNEALLKEKSKMFKELAPFLRQRAVLVTITHLDEDQIRVNVIPQKIKDGDNTALTTPLTVTGTAEELDRDLPATLVNFVGAHLTLKNNLDRAKQEMDAAVKAAQAEARSKSKSSGIRSTPKPEVAKPAETPRPAPADPTQHARPASLFDAPVRAEVPISDSDEEEEVLENGFTPECDDEEAA